MRELDAFIVKMRGLFMGVFRVAGLCDGSRKTKLCARNATVFKATGPVK